MNNETHFKLNVILNFLVGIIQFTLGLYAILRFKIVILGISMCIFGIYFFILSIMNYLKNKKYLLITHGITLSSSSSSLIQNYGTREKYQTFDDFHICNNNFDDNSSLLSEVIDKEVRQFKKSYK